MSRRHRFSGSFRSGWWLVAVAAVLPLSVLAQAEPGHDMGSMPGMTMDTPAKAAPKSKAAKKRPAPKAKAATAASAPASAAMPAMDHNAMPGMDHGKKTEGMSEKMAPMDHSQMGHDKGAATDQSAMPGMDHGAMKAMSPTPKASSDSMSGMSMAPGMDMDAMMKSMQGGPAPDGARDPNVYAEGLENGHMDGMDMADDAAHVRVLLDRVEQFHSSEGNGQAVDAQAWVGGDLDKLWLKVDGERSNGRLGATRTEALWNHAISTYWGLQAGVRHDFGDGPGRTWASFGFQGLSPYWFDIQATGYVGQNGRTALRFEGEYDLLLTQRLVLQPDVKVSLYGKNDRDRELGAGLSDIDAGLRLRYEFSRKFAPYIGVVFNRKFANTARYARDAGNPVHETRAVAGLRIWF
jgi:copper resistance protein B